MEIVTTEMHTGGGAVRIIEKGFPQLTSPTLMGKRSEVLEKHDTARKCILFEPRGHADLYGAILVESELKEADLGVIFIHNKGVGMMCGHAAIALARYAVHKGIVNRMEGDKTVVKLHCPAGLVEIRVLADHSAAYMSPLAYIIANDLDIKLADGRGVKIDVVYCGVFYALLNWTQLAIDIDRDSLDDLTRLGDQVKELAGCSVKLLHPDTDTKCFISGTVLYDGVNGGGNSKNLLIFADKQVERSACGTCVVARLALQYSKQDISLNQQKTFLSAVVPQSTLIGRVIEESEILLPGEDNPRQAVRVEVSGKGYYTGTSQFTVEPDDLISLGGGFLLK